MTDQEFQNESMDIARKASAKHPEDVTAAAKMAMHAARKCEWYAEFAEERELRYWRELIHDVRHNQNTALKRAAGQYGGPAKVTAGEVVNRVAMKSYYDYNIAGRILGNILGGELAALRDAEIERAHGSMFNASVCSALMPLVKEDQTVRACVSEKKLRGIIEKIRQAESHRVSGGVTVVNVKPGSAVSVTESPNGRTIPRGGLSGRKTKPDAKALAGG